MGEYRGQVFVDRRPVPVAIAGEVEQHLATRITRRLRGGAVSLRQVPQLLACRCRMIFGHGRVPVHAQGFLQHGPAGGRTIGRINKPGDNGNAGQFADRVS